MAKIGSFGDIVFSVSQKKTQTFSDFSRNGSSRWNKHDIIGLKQKSEFMGSDLEQLSLTIMLKAELGINPKKQADKLRKMKDTGKAAPFILGGKPLSNNYYVITQLDESPKVIDNKGNILISEVSLSLEEYVIKKKKTAKKTSKSVKKKTTTTTKKKTLGKIEITVKSVHIRSGPSTDHRVVGYAFKGDKFTVYSVKNGWYSLGKGKYITANSAYSKLDKG